MPSLHTWASGDILTASDTNTYLRQGFLLASGTGPSAQTDYSTATVVFTLALSVTTGQKLMVTAFASGTQVTNTSSATWIQLSDGTTPNRIWQAPLGINEAHSGGATLLYTAASSGTLTFSLTAFSSASAFRIGANVCAIQVVYAGT